ncbi:alkaline phosphatase [Nonomuraea sp. C10]|uniref:alkaline phosphatase D family protein n=1 Tax=Nonomuraea sp. C10 TaxID=2600577 RepID=UPI0011CD45E3|nr:alkaline phosphatase D family protein [Nonomuraea sp. C10]TXK40371.1 hypothetical protein FR742_12870 [Nonomuraea sp. C10]
MPELNRRHFLVTGLAAGAAAAVPAAAHADPGTTRALASRGPHADPFTLGVACGDPGSDGFVLWTRLAPQPLAEDGLGGMPARPVQVRWQVYADERCRRLVRSGVAVAAPEWGHSVHVELDGLSAGRDYWYRFRAGPYVSPVGRARTAPHPHSYGGPLAMAFVSCSQYEHGYFTAYRRLAEEHPDLILHLGDYQYEYARNSYEAPGGNVRDHEGPETETLADYRLRHAQYKTDPDLRAAHAAAPWLVVWDDHEVDNNWAGEVPERPDRPQPDFLARREAAFRAYYENMPLRRDSIPRGVDMQLFRRVRWGRMATFHMLDTRQYRDDQGCGDGADSDPATHPFLGINPHLRFYNNQRGYVITRVERERLTADFKVVPTVREPGAEAHTKATFVIEDRVPGVQQTYLRPLDPSARSSGQMTAEDTVRWETERP